MSTFVQRKFILRDAFGIESDVFLNLYLPQPTEHGDWSCTFEILLNGSVNTRFSAVGEDGLQALLLALPMAEATLKNLSGQGNRSLTWLGDDDPDLHLRTYIAP